MNKFTVDKYKIGITQECVFKSLMSYHNIQLDNLNDVSRFCSVDFKHQATNIYIELKYRQIPSDRYDTCVFDKKKVARWEASTMLSESYIYIYSFGLFR